MQLAADSAVVQEAVRADSAVDPEVELAAVSAVVAR
jgi:hypothetical protein